MDSEFTNVYADPARACDLALTAFTFDNIPTATTKVALLQSLRLGRRVSRGVRGGGAGRGPALEAAGRGVRPHPLGDRNAGGPVESV